LPAMPWKSFAAPERDKEYLALLSYLPLKTFRAMPKFYRYTRQIQRQLGDSEGLIGYSLDANVLNRKFWTLSVWKDEDSLMEFVMRNPHGRVMTDLMPYMGQTEFVRWKVSSSSIPPNWEEAKGRMQGR
jgi:hypothetical protein